MSDSSKVVLDGNVYYVRSGIVTKQHGKGEKVVVNRERIALVKAQSLPETKCEPSEAPKSNVRKLRK